MLQLPPGDINLKDKPDICGSCCGIFSLDCRAVLESRFWIKPKTHSERNASMNVCRENRCDGSCSVDKELHIKKKRKFLGGSS